MLTINNCKDCSVCKEQRKNNLEQGIQEEKEYTFDNYSATMLCEGVSIAESEEQLIAAWQYLIDTGLAWSLQGFFGRTAANLIETGICHA